MAKIFRAVIIFLFLSMFLHSYANAATFNTLQAYGVDTIAGYSTLLSTSKTYPNMDVVIVVEKPDGVKISIPAKTDSQGVAKLDLYDYHTRRAGEYEVSAYMKSNPVEGPVTRFTVYPDKISVDKSSIVPQKSVVKADGQDKVYLTVKILDQYGNPFSGHYVRVISSRANDIVNVSTSGASTDINGSITFTASSYEPGVSIFSAVDATSGAVLSTRASVAFLNSASYLEDIGGNLDMFIPVASAQEAGPLNRFDISGIPEIVQTNTNISFTVTAQDQNQLTVQNYTGTVHFSAEGPNSINVTLPEDYTFKADDLGTHEFSLGLKFTETGSYKIVVTDVANTSIKGEENVAVGTGTTTTTTTTGAKPTVTSPLEGTYSQNVQTVSGQAEELSTVKIFDNDQEIGMTQSDSSGSYSFQTTQLADGTHNIYVVWLDGNNEVQGTSDTVTINIDTTAPTVDDTEITPSTGIKAGDVVNVKVTSEENLSDAALIFNLEIYELSPSLDQPGVYISSFQAPDVPGEYPMDILLVDQLGNEATYQSVATVSISANGNGTITEETTIPEETGQPEEGLEQAETGGEPSQVFGVIAYGSDKRVTLVWEAATDDGTIDHYRIYYGLDPLSLTEVVDTKDAATTWYIPNLENGREYFFAISAVDDTGTESLFTSELVSAIPFTLEVETALPERPAEALTMGEEEAFLRGAAIEAVPPEMIKNGPGLLWLLAGTGILSGAAGKFRKKIKK